MTRARSILTAALALGALAALPSAAQAKISVGFSKQILVIQGDDHKDRAKVTCGADGNVRVNGKNPGTGPVGCDKVVEIDASMGGGRDVVDCSRVRPADFGRALFGGFGVGTGVAAVLGDGDDRYVASAGAFNLVLGEAGDDRANGGKTRDILVGGRGADIFNAGGGRDGIYGNAGADRLFGGAGADIVSGNAGDDRLDGGAGNDLLGGGTGRDRLRGGRGRDLLNGGAGRDWLKGGPGKDKERQGPR